MSINLYWLGNFINISVDFFVKHFRNHSRNEYMENQIKHVDFRLVTLTNRFYNKVLDKNLENPPGI